MSFLRRERAHVAYHKRFRFEIPLRASQSARIRVWQLGGNLDAVTNNRDLRRRNAGSHEQVANEIRHGNNRVAGGPVLKPVQPYPRTQTAGHECDAARSNALRPGADRGEGAQGLSAAVMRMQNLEAGARDLATQFADRGAQMITAAERRDAEPFLSHALRERTAVWTSDKLMVAALTEPTGQQQQLPLSAAQFAAGIKMKDSQKGLDGL